MQKKYHKYHIFIQTEQKRVVLTGYAMQIEGVSCQQGGVENMNMKLKKLLFASVHATG